jgi:hypothetical protein
MKCDRCQQELHGEERYIHGSETLCENCYLETTHRISPCDPWAAYHAQSYREGFGVEGTNELSELQKAIYEFIKGKGTASMDELLQIFDLPPRELQTSFAILRHCELVRAYKENDVIYLTTFSQK